MKNNPSGKTQSVGCNSACSVSIAGAEIVDELKIREKQKMTIKRSGKKIIVEDWPACRRGGEK